VAYIAPTAATNLAVNVTQLAQQQQVQTGLTTTDTTTTPGFSTTATQVYNTGSLTIQLGNVSSANGGSFSSNGSAIKVNITDGSLQGVVTAINNANTGVTAKLVQSTTGNQDYQIQLTGPDTGGANGFEITGTDTGSSAASLSTLNYGTDSSTNSTNYAGSVQAAQDAEYSVNGSQLSSPTNQGVPVASGININLLTTGSTIISQPEAPTSITNAANSLASTISGMLQTLGQFTQSGGPLNSDPSTVNMFEADINLALNQTYGSGQTELLSQIGVTEQSDGTYAVDTSTLSAAYQNDPNGVSSVLSAVAGALTQVVQQYSGQYGQVAQNITSLNNQISIYTGQFQVDEQVSSAANSQAASAVQAYNLLSEANGGSASAYTSEV
jgi:flagellar hook-associated protein 2